MDKLLLALIPVLFLALPGAAGDQVVEADAVLKNATIYDGTDQPGKVGDLAIKGDKVVAIGKFKVRGDAKVIDCTGLVLTPGFIDLHTHSDNPLTQNATRSNLNYLKQGVTTVVTGNCGMGPADVEPYFTKLEKGGIGSNVIHQIPHNSVRQKIMGNVNRAPTDKELLAMENLVEEGMKAGACGMATGLYYNPGAYAKTDELVALSKVAAKYDGLYASHIRDEGETVLDSIEEVLTIARRAGIRVHVSHIKVWSRRAWGKAADVIAMIRRERAKGLQVTADQYPYAASSTSLLATVVPSRFREGTNKELIERLDDPDAGPRLKKAIQDHLNDQNGGQALQIATYAKKPGWQGKNLVAIAEQEKKSPLDITLEILRNGGASIVIFAMREEDIRLFMKESFVATASDGSSMVPGMNVPHPRNYGCFPRKIGRYAIEEKVIGLEQAIRSASGLPADILKLSQRGYLKAGNFADVVVFDPKTFRDAATYEQPHQYATGVRYLFVNGKLVLNEGRYDGELAGRILRHRLGEARTK